MLPFDIFDFSSTSSTPNTEIIHNYLFVSLNTQKLCISHTLFDSYFDIIKNDKGIKKIEASRQSFYFGIAKCLKNLHISLVSSLQFPMNFILFLYMYCSYHSYYSHFCTVFFTVRFFFDFIRS